MRLNITNDYIFFTVIIFFIITFSSCVPERIKNIKYNHTEVKKERLNKGKWGKFRAHLVYNNEPYATYDQVHPERLTFDMYKPYGKENEVLPLVICIHSGGFLVGDKKNYIINHYCKDIVRTGDFATASINYRIIDNTKFEDLSNLGVFFSKAYTRDLLMQSLGDVRSAIKYFIENSSELNIDCSRIYILGFSAGAILANQAIYTDLTEAEEYIIAHTLDKIADNVYPELFEIDNKSAFNYKIKDNIKGVVSIGGAVLDQKMLGDDMDNIDIPMLYIHGSNDGMVPIGNEEPFQRYSIKDLKIPLSNFYFDLGVKSQNDGTLEEELVDTTEQIYHVSIEIGTKLKKEIIKTVIDLFTSPMCGSECIYESTFKDENSKLIKITGGPHVFMLNDNGLFNRTYTRTRDEIYRFLKKTNIRQRN